MGKIKYEEVNLTDKEYKEALFEKDSLAVQVEILKFNLESFKKEIKLKIPHRRLERNLDENLKKMQDQLQLLEENLKVYEKQVRTKKKEVPKSLEEDPKDE